ncbi:MAG: hypothetical protein KBA53_10220 [Thermoclostridium sp.]|nr:hypothetical protein [Thermoclostridium sp.]
MKNDTAASLYWRQPPALNKLIWKKAFCRSYPPGRTGIHMMRILVRPFLIISGN